jgi:hypothetical protein
MRAAGGCLSARHSYLHTFSSISSPSDRSTPRRELSSLPRMHAASAMCSTHCRKCVHAGGLFSFPFVIYSKSARSINGLRLSLGVRNWGAQEQQCTISGMEISKQGDVPRAWGRINSHSCPLRKFFLHSTSSRLRSYIILSALALPSFSARSHCT